MTSRLVVLVSGGGTNLQAVMDACAAGVLDAEVVGVISNKSDAYGLDRARLAGIPAIVLERDKIEGGRDRRTYDSELRRAVEAFQPDVVVMAGWMRIITMAFLGHFRVLNLHPALPGMFPGIRAIERAFEAWEDNEIAESGVMVHWVPDEGVDDGPVIVQRSVPFLDGDSLDLFETRLHSIEHELLVEGISVALSQQPTSKGKS